MDLMIAETLSPVDGFRYCIGAKQPGSLDLCQKLLECHTTENPEAYMASYGERIMEGEWDPDVFFRAKTWNTCNFKSSQHGCYVTVEWKAPVGEGTPPTSNPIYPDASFAIDTSLPPNLLEKQQILPRRIASRAFASHSPHQSRVVPSKINFQLQPCDHHRRTSASAHSQYKGFFDMEDELAEKIDQLGAIDLRRILWRLCLDPKHKEAVTGLLPKDRAKKLAKPQPSKPSSSWTLPTPYAQSQGLEPPKEHASRASSVNTTSNTRQKCKRCDHWFSATTNTNKACKLHPGTVVLNPNSLIWRTLERGYVPSDYDNGLGRRLIPHGFHWSCCRGVGPDCPPCIELDHEPRPKDKHATGLSDIESGDGED
ncbi:uncharacterized protein PG986_012649 [Apiospora aurea]|uniref:C2H2-type domain-containing protein n=1 Tax=Apiospora aurea TaxID=335848 RepID=A0ABR1Q1T1_9PEZI